ncbi:hypothetical protein ACDT10_01900 [Mycobacterium intracellulare]|uniref:hypothetical protein n=1 Tax=Mycobacterium intracellulare TaxID=1767 RepID=UPI0035569BBD
MTARRAIRRFGTPAHRAAQAGAPRQTPRRYTRDELRARRRAGFTAGHYSGDWSLAAEIAAVCRPLADRIAAAEHPGRFRHAATPASVPALAEAVHELVGTGVGWVAEADARRKTAHLADEPGKRRYAMQTLIDLAKRPALPEVTDNALADGSWADQLIGMTEGIDAAFSALLARSYPPGAAELRGQTSRSERLDALLRRTIDRAAVALERRLDRDEHHRRPDPDDRAPDERARAALAAMGVQTD